MKKLKIKPRIDSPKGRVQPIDVSKMDKMTPEEKTEAKIQGLWTLQRLIKKAKEKNSTDILKRLLPIPLKKFRDDLLGQYKDKNNAPKFAMDACDDFSTNDLGFSINNPDVVKTIIEPYIGWQMAALVAQNLYVNRVCLAPAVDAMAPSFRLESEEEDGFSLKELNDMRRESIRKFKITETCIKASYDKRVYGASLVMPLIKGANLEEPMDLKKIKKGSYLGLRPIEPFWYTYGFNKDTLTNPLEPEGFYEPSYYVLAGTYSQTGSPQKVHKSWCVKLINAPVGTILLPSYYFLGLSTAQQIYERVYAMTRIANEAPLLALTKRCTVMDADIDFMVMNPEEALATIDAYSRYRDNFGVLIKGEGKNVSQLDTSLTDFDQLIQKQAEMVASIGEVPVEKIVKTNRSSGMNGGLYQENEYKQVLRRFQEFDALPLILHHLSLYLASEKGIYDLGGLTPVFNPIDTPSEKELSEIREATARMLAHLSALGQISTSEGREWLRKNPIMGFASLAKEPENSIDFDNPEDAPMRENYKNMGISNTVKIGNSDKDGDGKQSDKGE